MALIWYLIGLTSQSRYTYNNICEKEKVEIRRSDTSTTFVMSQQLSCYSFPLRSKPSIGHRGMRCRIFGHDWRPLLLWFTSSSSFAYRATNLPFRSPLRSSVSQQHACWWHKRRQRPSMFVSIVTAVNNLPSQIDMDYKFTTDQLHLLRFILLQASSFRNDPSLATGIASILDNFLNKYWDDIMVIPRPEAPKDVTDLLVTTTHSISLVTAIFRCLAVSNGSSETRQKMQKVAQSLIHLKDAKDVCSSASSILSCVMLVTSLSIVPVVPIANLEDGGDEDPTANVSRAAARAVMISLSSALPNDFTIRSFPWLEEWMEITFETLALVSKALSPPIDPDSASLVVPMDFPFVRLNYSRMDDSALGSADFTARMDFHILRSLVQCLNLNSCETDAMAQAVAMAVTHALQESAVTVTSPPVLRLAAQMRPWSVLDPTILVQYAVQYDLWDSAERICLAAAEHETVARSAIYALIDGSVTQRFYRKADRFATLFYDSIVSDAEGRCRFLNARYLHACSSIRKLLRRRLFQVIGRIVERIDFTVEKLKSSTCEDKTVPILEIWDEVGTTMDTARTDIRSFALQQLEYDGSIDIAHRFAQLWNMDYVFDEEVMKRYILERKQKYLQWEEFFPDQSIPQLISTSDMLDVAMKDLGSCSVYGFDVEWGNNEEEPIVTGAALLQIATIHGVVLLDIPALSATLEGVQSLERNIGALFRRPSTFLVGFHCREDISKLRSSPYVGTKHWLPQNPIVCDLQSLVKSITGSSLGLSRCCEVYLKKPLDKSEQCSEWNQRPLSEPQRVYAALDAYVCARVYSEHFTASP
jgi:3'-5' exonuclease